MNAGNLAQERVHVARSDPLNGPRLVTVLKQPWARKRPQNRNRRRQHGRGEFLAYVLAAFGAEDQRDHVAGDSHVRLQQRRRTARAVLSGVFLAAGADRASRDQLDGGGEREIAGGLGAAQMLRYGAADFWEDGSERRKAAGLFGLADLFPVYMVAILQPGRGVPPYRLKMRALIGAVIHLLVGGRDGQGGEPAEHRLVGDPGPVRAEIGVALALPLPADGELIAFNQMK